MGGDAGHGARQIPRSKPMQAQPSRYGLPSIGGAMAGSVGEGAYAAASPSASASASARSWAASSGVKLGA
jgi:hypothetical protein